MKQTLERKDNELTGARKVAREKTEAAERKLASVGKLEEENATLKTVVDEVKKEAAQLREEKVVLVDKVEQLTQKRDELEDYLRALPRRCASCLKNFEQQTERIEPGLDPTKSLVKDEAAMNVLRLEARLDNILGYIARLKAWKKSATCCGADVALSLVRVHCKDEKEEKLKALQVANAKKLQFESFMETFIEAATRMADGINLDAFVEPASPPPAE
nr:rab11 family-interacting protein 3-like [Aegilops tauschii subsp. strangulata]